MGLGLGMTTVTAVNTNDVPVASSAGLQDYAISQGTGTGVAGTESIVIIGVVILIAIGLLYAYSRV